MIVSQRIINELMVRGSTNIQMNLRIILTSTKKLLDFQI
jgi:hypothetical protein